MFYNLPGQKYDLSSHVNRYSHSKQKTYITKSSKSPASIAKSNKQGGGDLLVSGRVQALSDKLRSSYLGVEPRSEADDFIRLTSSPVQYDSIRKSFYIIKALRINFL